MTTRQDISELSFKIEILKREFLKRIAVLPDNPNIKRLNKDGAFTMSSSQIFGSKDMIMSASYYDFKNQYKKLVEILEKTDSSIVFDKLDTIIKNKAIPLKNNETLRLHPDIIENLTHLIKNK